MITVKHKPTMDDVRMALQQGGLQRPYITVKSVHPALTGGHHTHTLQVKATIDDNTLVVLMDGGDQKPYKMPIHMVDTLTWNAPCTKQSTS